MNAQHTPGPWGFETFSAERSRFFAGFTVFNPCGGAVCDVLRTDKGDDGEERANARIIAAAPEMELCIAQAAGMLHAMADILAGRYKASPEAEREVCAQHQKCVSLLARIAGAEVIGNKP